MLAAWSAIVSAFRVQDTAGGRVAQALVFQYRFGLVILASALDEVF